MGADGLDEAENITRVQKNLNCKVKMRKKSRKIVDNCDFHDIIYFITYWNKLIFSKFFFA